MNDQYFVFGILGLTLVLFVLGTWRYDVVALGALVVLTVADIVPVDEAFTGFGHPAVVTVAAILVISKSLQNSGALDVVTKWMDRVGPSQTVQLLVLMGLVAVCSAFINNVGALALFMPVAIAVARKHGRPPSAYLMPLAFGSLLGGMTTLTGTPPNIIIATFRESAGAGVFKMFDFTIVGIGVAVAGVLFVSLVGWRLIPQRKGPPSPEELFQIEGYITEVRAPEGSKMVGEFLREVEASIDGEIAIVGLVRGDRRMPAPSGYITVRPHDILIVQADTETLQALLDATGFELVGSEEVAKDLSSDEVAVMEVVISLGAAADGRSAQGLNLRRRYGVNLLAVARQGANLRGRLANIRFRAGDVLLMQGPADRLQDAMGTLGLLPLAERGLRIGQPRRAAANVALLATAIVLAATGVIAIQVAFVGAAVIMAVTGLISPREAYEGVEWPIVILLGAMIPVGMALESTGGAQRLADVLLDLSGQSPEVVTLVIVLVGTMFLSDLINNAAAAVLMAPIAIDLSAGLGASADPFLMAVAIGASSAFLTPIGHQSNTLVLGPGGYKFGDYWRMGLPLELIIVAVSVPLLLVVWPL